MTSDLRRDDRVTASVVELAQELIRRPSRAGIDDHGPVLAVLADWLAAHGLPYRRLYDGTRRPGALLVEVAGGRPGNWWALDACVDTAPYGDEASWSFPPDCGAVADGWLLGRGAADSKLAAALFCHVAAELRARAGELRGGLAVLLDADEHTGGFGGARAYLADPDAVRPAGVMIGYPRLEEVVVGGRGLWRATVAVHAAAGHSGSRRVTAGAVSRAARLVRLLEEARLPGAGGEFPLPPKLTVTSCHGGEGFSVVPDRCEVGLDIRTIPAFDARAAEALVRTAAAELDAVLPAPCPTEISPVAAWPPYRLAEHEQPAAALLDAAAREGLRVRAKTAGPSNIGNLLAAEGIPATAGFGLPYEGLHGVDERVRLADLPVVHAVYRRAVLSLLDGSGRSPVLEPYVQLLLLVPRHRGQAVYGEQGVEGLAEPLDRPVAAVHVGVDGGLQPGRAGALVRLGDVERAEPHRRTRPVQFLGNVVGAPVGREAGAQRVEHDPGVVLAASADLHRDGLRVRSLTVHRDRSSRGRAAVPRPNPSKAPPSGEDYRRESCRPRDFAGRPPPCWGIVEGDGRGVGETAPRAVEQGESAP
ncbi:hypothetical protein GCM10027074_57190 [Streptomyces deserti]